MISKSDNYLIAVSDQIATASKRLIISDNVHFDLVGDQKSPPVVLSGGVS